MAYYFNVIFGDIKLFESALQIIERTALTEHVGKQILNTQITPTA